MSITDLGVRAARICTFFSRLPRSFKTSFHPATVGFTLSVSVNPPYNHKQKMGNRLSVTQNYPKFLHFRLLGDLRENRTLMLLKAQTSADGVAERSSI
jgi:hypothetical protein